MSESYQAGILDTSVLIDIAGLDPEKLPEASVTTALTLTELASTAVPDSTAYYRMMPVWPSE